MIKNINRIIFLVFLVSTITFAQQKPKLNRSQYNSKLDSLLQLKEQLISQKTEINKSIDSLNKKSSILDTDLRKALKTVYAKRYGRKVGNRIINKRIWKGMTENMLRDSWGKPDRINKNIEKWGRFTQWLYGKIEFFFRDGKLTGWEEKK